jgi:transcriptional regulator with XRE-family HTH domain
MAQSKQKHGAPTSPAAALAPNMRALRKARGWSQSDLAREIGATLTHVSRVETGKYSPSVDFVIKLARVFGVGVDTLLAEHADGLQEVRIEDKDLAERLRLLESLDAEERQALIKVIDSMLTKKKMLDLLTAEKRVA